MPGRRTEETLDWSLKIVAQIPLAELWTSDGPVDAKRGRDVGVDEVTALLRAGAVRFVIADVGLPLRWIPTRDCFSYWKSEVKSHLVAAGAAGFHYADYPGEYCYAGSEWPVSTDDTVVVLEMYH